MLSPNKTYKYLSERTDTCVLFIFVFCFFTFGLPLTSGLPSGFDMVTDIRFSIALREALEAGNMFPGWANDNFGFGSVGVRFYPPLSLYLLTFTELIISDWFWALWVNLLFWMTLGCIGVFLFAREWAGPTAGLIAAMAYAVAPQHLAEVFQFFLFAEFAAWGIIPFCFFYLTRICRGGGWRDVVLFSISYSVLILTHIPTTIIASLAFPVYTLLALDWKHLSQRFLHLSTAVLLSIGATMFRSATIITEFSWLAHNDPKYMTGYFQFREWLFPNILTERSQFLFVMTSWLFDIAIVMTVSLTVPAFLLLWRRRKSREFDAWPVLLASTGTALFAFFMLSRPSESLWEWLPFLQKIQFPWRWMSVVSLLAVVAFSISVTLLFNELKGKERIVAYPAILAFTVIILFNITQIIIPSAPIPYAEFESVERQITEEPLFEGWWPVWAKPTALEDRRLIVAGGRTADIAEWSSDKRGLRIGDGEATDVRIATFYYPHWKSFVNGEEVETRADENGVILVPVPAGDSVVAVNFEEPVHVRIARWASAVTWSMIFITALLIRRREGKLRSFS